MSQNMPHTFEEAVDFVCDVINKKTVTQPGFHFTGGMSIRNGLDLWNKSGELNKHMVERFGLCHADDLGALITNAAHARKNGKRYNPEEDVEKFKKHWISYGLDPATMEKI